MAHEEVLADQMELNRGKPKTQIKVQSKLGDGGGMGEGRVAVVGEWGALEQTTH